MNLIFNSSDRACKQDSGRNDLCHALRRSRQFHNKHFKWPPSNSLLIYFADDQSLKREVKGKWVITLKDVYSKFLINLCSSFLA